MLNFFLELLFPFLFLVEPPHRWAELPQCGCNDSQRRVVHQRDSGGRCIQLERRAREVRKKKVACNTESMFTTGPFFPASFLLVITLEYKLCVFRRWHRHPPSFPNIIASFFSCFLILGTSTGRTFLFFPPSISVRAQIVGRAAAIRR